MSKHINNFLKNIDFDSFLNPSSTIEFSQFIHGYMSKFLSPEYKVKGIAEQSLKNHYTGSNHNLPFIFNSQSNFRTEHINFFRKNIEIFSKMEFQPATHPFHQITSKSILNKNDVSSPSLQQFVFFLSFLYMLNASVDFDKPLNKNLFLICKELKSSIIKDSFEFNPDSPNEFFSTLKHGHRTLQIEDSLRHSLYSIIEQFISYDKEFVFSHLFNLNVLYKMGLPVLTDHKHFHPLKEETLDKIISYSQIVSADANANYQNKSNTQHVNYFFSQKTPNSFSYVYKSAFYEALHTISAAHLSNGFKASRLQNNQITTCNYLSTPNTNYSFENILNDFLSYKDISKYLEIDFSQFTNKDKSNFFIIQQYMDVNFPLIYETLHKTLYISHPYLKPVYWDNITAKITNHRFYISEPYFSEKHIPLSLYENPLTISTLLFYDSFHRSLTYQEKLQKEIFELDTTDIISSILKSIGKTLDDTMNHSKITHLKKFRDEIYPIIRENHLKNMMSAIPKNNTHQKRKI